MYVPRIVLWIRKVIGPYFELFWNQLINACACVWKSSYPLRVLCGKYIHTVFNMVSVFKIKLKCYMFEKR